MSLDLTLTRVISHFPGRLIISRQWPLDSVLVLLDSLAIYGWAMQWIDRSRNALACIHPGPISDMQWWKIRFEWSASSTQSGLPSEILNIIIQGSANPRGPGSVKMRRKSCVLLLPAAGKRTQFFSSFSRTLGPRGLADACTVPRGKSMIWHCWKGGKWF